MTYAAQTWHDKPALDTPITAARLGHMETGIAVASELLDTVDSGLAWCARNPGQIIPSARLTYFDKPDAAFGSLPAAFDTGQPLAYANGSVGDSTPVISNGGYRLARGTGGGLANVYNYLDAGAGHLLRRIGFKFRVDGTGATTDTWAIGFSFNNGATLSAGGTAYRMGIHISLGKTTYGITKVSNATGALVFTNILDPNGVAMFGSLLTPITEDNFTEYSVQGWIVGQQFIVALPDGQLLVSAADPDIANWATQYGYFQHLMVARNTDATPVLTEVWYDTDAQHAPGNFPIGGNNIRNYVTLAGIEDLSNKTLRNPIIDFINDTNGDPILLFSPVASTVNYVQMFGGSATHGPTIQAQGADADIDFNMAGRGAGWIVGNADIMASRAAAMANAMTFGS